MSEKYKGRLENNIFLLRAERRWSQKELASKVGVSRQTIISLENNRYSPSLVLAFEISRVFEKDISDIFTYVKGE
ncbi:helix-turn-helix transcriptional regulator [Evansella halocellulosilytica]|uniref:helix-turn-helix transcriptional regulator n=1 Tax=Evansella halocellulosilytica TaxID=2011013 RepID=UPI000BB73EDC|nr:helix-turn-helix transcriptional regulator [Evansella halocellulosilytica]